MSDAGAEYVVLDDLSRGRASFVDPDKLIVGRIGDEALVESICREYHVEALVHFAAFAYVGESVVDPELYYGNNIVETFRLLRACRRSGVRNVVFSSSCATYGSPECDAPLAESTPQIPINSYGTSKLTVERMLLDYERAYGLQSVILRYFNAAGASETHELYEAHDPETHLIPLVIEAATGGLPLVVYGNDFPTTDGSCVRDYIHVDDLAAAHLSALRYLGEMQPSVALNLGVGKGYSVFDIIAAVERVLGDAPQYSVGARRPGDPPYLVADGGRARDVLGWVPKYDAIDRIVRTAVLGQTRAHADRSRRS
jgi:UDP-glucose-4-epimerase GalE